MFVLTDQCLKKVLGLCKLCFKKVVGLCSFQLPRPYARYGMYGTAHTVKSAYIPTIHIFEWWAVKTLILSTQSTW